MPISFSIDKLARFALGGVLVVYALSAGAKVGDTLWPEVRIRGFGTLGANYHHDDGVRFRRDISQAGGAESGRISLVQDSMLGLQLNVSPHRQWEISAQAVSRLTSEDNFDPQLTWGYIKYKPLEEAALRFGRLGVESYLQGDSAEIGYANLRIRQPIIFYPRTHDGMDAEWSQPLAGGTLRFKGSAGWTQGESVNSGVIYDTGGSELLGAVAEYAHSGWTARLAYYHLLLHDELNDLKPGARLAQLVAGLPNGAAIHETLTLKNRSIDFPSFALAYDAGPLQAQASYSIYSSPHWSMRHLFYATLGYRVGDFTPYLSYATQRTDRKFIATGIPNGAGLDSLNQAATNAQTAFMVNQSDFGLGLRYDFADNMALKFQADHIRYQDPESIVDASLLSQSAENRSTRSLTVFSVALDFVF
ncbi:MAG: hypothetical protein LUQ11_12660 [Methylococcaceae bacterium]|nr:hypothetical protein [Methylococcaceae bacterium]